MTAPFTDHHEATLSLRRPRLWERMLESWLKDCAAGELKITYPGGRRHTARGTAAGPSAAVHLHSSALIWKVLASGEVGFAESYMDGDWTTPDLQAVVAFGLENQKALGARMRGAWLTRLMSALAHARNANTRAGSRRNIAFHYDLGNRFYAEWLDRTMSYSSACFEGPNQSFEAAQRAKYRRLLGALGLKPGDKLLEIGCGWGACAEIAAKEFGADVTAVTLSEQQAAWTRERLQAQGLASRADVRLQDYRDIGGTHDAIVSVEMFEAVGEKNWPTFFNVLRNRLRPGGRAALQVITVADQNFETYRTTIDFIQRYIFPGGMLPSPGAFRTAVAEAGLLLERVDYFAADYALTLKLWRERFEERWEAIRSLGFDERFRRMWTYYLASCEACFRTGATDVGQFVIVRP